MGLLKHTDGKMYIDEEEILKDKNQLVENIGYVPQEIFLFEDELKRNIAKFRFGRCQNQLTKPSGDLIR